MSTDTKRLLFEFEQQTGRDDQPLNRNSTRPLGDALHCGQPAATQFPTMSDRIWYLYLVRCADGQLYTGISTDVQRRLQQHANDRGARRLRGRAPLQLAYSQAIGDRSQALRMEHRVKRMRRDQKEALIEGRLPLPVADDRSA